MKTIHGRKFDDSITEPKATSWRVHREIGRCPNEPCRKGKDAREEEHDQSPEDRHAETADDEEDKAHQKAEHAEQGQKCGHDGKT